MTHKLLKNPLVRACGIAAILYFSLFANKENPNSLGNRFSQENLQKGFKEAKEKGQFIIRNVTTAQSLSKKRHNQEQMGTINKEILIECGDEIFLDYSLYQAEQMVLAEKNKIFTVGSRENWLIEKNVIGMKVEESKNIDIFNSSEKSNNLKYHVTIRKINQNVANNISKNDCE